jgi:hypothetical protein
MGYPCPKEIFTTSRIFLITTTRTKLQKKLNRLRRMDSATNTVKHRLFLLVH